jgi:hypothetical protein
MTQSHIRQPLDMQPVFRALVTPLGLIDSPERRQDIERYFDAARVHLERAIFDLLDTTLRAVNEVSPDTNFSLQYDAGTPVLVADAKASDDSSEPDAEPTFSMDGDLEKVTIRLPKELKHLVDNAATMSGRSANSWYIRNLAHALRDSIQDDAGRQRRGRGHGWGHHRRDFPAD